MSVTTSTHSPGDTAAPSVGNGNAADNTSDGGDNSSGIASGAFTKSYDTLGTIPRVRVDTATARKGIDFRAYITRSTGEVTAQHELGYNTLDATNGFHMYAHGFGYCATCGFHMYTYETRMLLGLFGKLVSPPAVPVQNILSRKLLLRTAVCWWVMSGHVRRGATTDASAPSFPSRLN